MRAMLATDGDLGRMVEYVNDDNWWFEQKIDGHRIVIDGGPTPTMLNRNGQTYSKKVPHDIRDLLGRILDSFGEATIVLDGELVTDTYWLFDAPTIGTLVTPDSPYNVRRQALDHIEQSLPWMKAPDSPIKVVPIARTSTEKALLARRVLEIGGEGIIAKKWDEPYRPGVRSREMLKFKYVNDAEVVVTETNRLGKDSLALGIYRDGDLIDIGACSSIGKEPVTEGDVITVRYLYLGADERLVQPRMMRRREDKAKTDCDWSQLRPVNKDVLHDLPTA